MEENYYLKDVQQTNGCRTWLNPKTNVEFNIPEKSVEIFISNLPKDFLEIDILPHFERFGPIYNFRLLVDFNAKNRGFAYLIYFYEISALQCLDIMGYFLIKPGVMLSVEKSQVRSHLMALNVPSYLPDNEIVAGFRSIYAQLTSVHVRRGGKPMEQEKRENKSTCAVILGFPDHDIALTAKRWSGVGSINLWSRNIKILWARSDQIEDPMEASEETKHVLIHNVPDEFDEETFSSMMCSLILPREIVSIRPMFSDWMIEFVTTQAAFTVHERFNGLRFQNNVLQTELVTPARLSSIPKFADFDFDLRCFCIANYWDPPIFIYGQIFSQSKIQFCAAIIKDRRSNMFTTFLIEMNFNFLTEIHARVCELLLLVLMDLQTLPLGNIIIKCSENQAFIAGVIDDLNDPDVIPSICAWQEPIYLFHSEIYALAKMCHQLITLPNLDDIYQEYKMILKEKNPNHQFICGVFRDGNVLGCIDPIYRRGKPLNFGLDPRHMMLAMCSTDTFSNTGFTVEPSASKIKVDGSMRQTWFKNNSFDLIPISISQRENVHYVYRPCIIFYHFDTFASLPKHQLDMMQQSAPVPVQQQNPRDAYCFKSFMNSLPM